MGQGRVAGTAVGPVLGFLRRCRCGQRRGRFRLDTPGCWSTGIPRSPEEYLDGTAYGAVAYRGYVCTPRLVLPGPQVSVTPEHAQAQRNKLLLLASLVAEQQQRAAGNAAAAGGAAPAVGQDQEAAAREVSRWWSSIGGPAPAAEAQGGGFGR